jgi:hypothetical protein
VFWILSANSQLILGPFSGASSKLDNKVWKNSSLFKACRMEKAR